MKIGVLLSRVRVEEKWLFEALDKRGIDYDKIDDREIKLNLDAPGEWFLDRGGDLFYMPLPGEDPATVTHPAEIAPLIVHLAQADLGLPHRTVVFNDWKTAGGLPPTNG